MTPLVALALGDGVHSNGERVEGTVWRMGKWGWGYEGWGDGARGRDKRGIQRRKLQGLGLLTLTGREYRVVGSFLALTRSPY